MAECSQEFKDMLEEFYGEAYEDGIYECNVSPPARHIEAAVLQYVAQLEAIRDKAREVALVAVAVGGMP